MPRLDVALAHQGEVRHRDHPGLSIPRPRPIPVAERVQLFDVRELHAGLLADPGPQTELEGAVAVGVEGTEGQGGEAVVTAAARDRQHPGLRIGDGDDGGVQPHRDVACHLANESSSR